MLSHSAHLFLHHPHHPNDDFRNSRVCFQESNARKNCLNIKILYGIFGNILKYSSIKRNPVKVGTLYCREDLLYD